MTMHLAGVVAGRTPEFIEMMLSGMSHNFGPARLMNVGPPHMNASEQRRFVCGIDERHEDQSRQISHLVSVSNPGAASSVPAWFKGAHLQPWFGDVISETDARNWKIKAASIEDVQRSVVFVRDAWMVKRSRNWFN